MASTLTGMTGARFRLFAPWLFLAPFAIYASQAGLDQLVAFFPDDGFYYLQPAFNLARFGTSSFDGVHATNGFHPLNFLVTVGLATVFDKGPLVTAVFLFDAAIVMMAASVLVWREFRVAAPAAYITLAVVVSPVCCLFLWLSSGLEAALVVLTTVCLQVAWERAAGGGTERIWNGLALGLSLAAVVYARFDLLVLWVPFVAGSVWAWKREGRDRRPARARVLLVAWTSATVIVAAYFAANLVTTGHLLTVSAWVKSHDPVRGTGFLPSTRHEIVGQILVWMPAVVSAGALVGTYLAPERVAAALARLVWINAANLLWYVYLAAAVPSVFRWYFAFPAACLMLDVAAMAGAVAGRRTAAVETCGRTMALAAVVASLCATFVSLQWIGSRPSSVSRQLLEVARRLDAVSSAGEVTAVADAGVIGYVSSGRVINIDGLANDFDYAVNYLAPRRLAAYLAREGVTIYLARDEHLTDQAGVRAGTYEQTASLLDPSLILRRDREIFRQTLPGQFSIIAYRLRLPPSR